MRFNYSYKAKGQVESLEVNLRNSGYIVSTRGSGTDVNFLKALAHSGRATPKFCLPEKKINLPPKMVVCTFKLFMRINSKEAYKLK